MERKENSESPVAHQLSEKKKNTEKKSRNKTATLSGTNIKEQHSRLGTKLDRQKKLSAREKQNNKNRFLNIFLLYSESSLLSRRHKYQMVQKSRVLAVPLPPL